VDLEKDREDRVRSEVLQKEQEEEEYPKPNKKGRPSRLVTS